MAFQDSGLPPGFVLDPPNPRPVQPRPIPPQQPGGYGRIVTGGPRVAPLPTPQVPTVERNTELNSARTGQVIRQSDTGGVNFSDENSLRSQYQGLQPVRDYQAVAPIVNSALRARPGGAGDLDIVYGFAKVMDPGSVVREGEVQMSQGTGSLGEQVQGYLQQIRTGGALTPSVRQRLIATIQNRADQYRSAYQQTRKQYWTNAERYRFDPQAIVGQDIDAAYQPGPNAPIAAQAPGAAPAPPTNLSSLGGAANAITGALASVGAGAVTGQQSQLPSVNAQGGLTSTDPHESAQSQQSVARLANDNSGAASNPQMESGAATAYTNEWTAAVNSGLDRNGLDQWVRENAPRFFPGQTPGQVDDRMWSAIQESRRQGVGMTWQPPTIGVDQLPENFRNVATQAYQDQAENARGAEARSAWAEQHPYLASADTAVRNVANALTLNLADRIAGRFNGEGGAFEHGVTNQDWRDRPIESLTGTLAGSAPLPYGRTLPQQIVRGDIMGGVSAYNGADGSQSDRLMAAGQGAGASGGVAALMGGAGRLFLGGREARQAVIDAGNRQGVYVPRYVSGGTAARMAAGGFGATPGRIPLERGSQRFVDTLAAARDRTANGMGQVFDRAGAGQRAQAGARAFLQNSADRANQLADRIPIRPETPSSISNTREALTELTAGLDSNPQLSALMQDRTLNAYRDALQSGGLSWGDLRRFRSQIGERIGQPPVAGETTSRAALRRLYGAITQDMQATAEASGPRALTAFNRFNQYWRGRESRREGVVQSILGRNFDESAENAFTRINQWARNDFRSAGQALRSMPREDADAVRASIFARMGRAKPGQQTEIDGSTFSPGTFATEWQQIDERARQFLVPNGRHRRNLDDIALLATRGRQAESFSNTSRTGLAVLTGNALIGANNVFTHPLLTALGVGSSMAAGRLLATPEGSRTLLNALRNPVLQQRLIQQLSPQDGEDAPEQN